MEKVLEFLKECGTFYLATEEGDQARVRPFGAIYEYEGKLYTATNNTKNCFKQMMKNPKVEVCSMNKRGQWIRITAKLVNDDRREAREYALETGFPSIKSMYSVDDGIFSVMYFEDCTATIASFTAESETITF